MHDPLADGTHEVVISLSRPFDVRLAGGYLDGVREIVIPFDGEEAAGQAASGIIVTVREGTRPESAGSLAALHRRLREASAEAAELRAEIVRLRAELDARDGTSTEWVPEHYLEHAMAHDSYRRDGTVLRCTDNPGRAVVWRTAAGEWEPVT